jgi:hypothetical protein
MHEVPLPTNDTVLQGCVGDPAFVIYARSSDRKRGWRIGEYLFWLITRKYVLEVKCENADFPVSLLMAMKSLSCDRICN